VGAVTVTLLGGFSAVVDGEPVPESAWRLKKARELVKLLALAPDHRLHREQVMRAEYLTVIATSLLIPFELYELARNPTLWKAGGVLVNVAIVVYLGLALRRRLAAGRR
jgi:uncharacterized membrane protein (DUF2068 family)